MITLVNSDFSEVNSFLADLQPSKIIILVDENTHEHCLPVFLGSLQTNISYEIIEIDSGEEMKTIETAAQLWDIFSEFEADRKTLLINLGGGVITDLGGFVASTYKRGIKFINIPTTLLGMCDASVGGKTGIDHGNLKNLVGTFAEAEQVFIYPDFLKTLPFRELRSGFAEMLKHSLIADEKHWKDLISIDNISAESVAPYIEQSVQIKQNIVRADFMEQHVRKTLNFGHTAGHAIESMFLQEGKPIPHGEAVAAGMIIETKIAELRGILNPSVTDEVVSQISKYFPKLDILSFTNEELFFLMKNDKKNNAQNISFSLINAVGSCIYNEICDQETIFEAFTYYKSLAL